MPPKIDPDTMDQIEYVWTQHNRYWQAQENEILLAESLYAHDWWGRYASLHEPMAAELGMAGASLLETEEGYTTVESALAQIFVSSPGVVVQPDPTDADATQPGMAPAVQELLNNWLSRPEYTAALKQAARWGLIYRYSGMALESVAPGRLGLKATPLRPWELLVDTGATSVRGDDWSFIGRVHRLTKAEAKAAGFTLGRGQRWTPQAPSDGLPDTMGLGSQRDPGPPPCMGLVEIIEWHDLLSDEPPMFLAPQEYITGPRTDTGRLIPIKRDEDHWSRLIPLYLGTGAIEPLRGSSLLGRMAPALVLKNWLLTMYARRSKRASVKTLASSRLGEDAIVKLTNGILDEVIPVETPGDLTALVRNIDSNSNPQEWAEAFNLVQSEIDRSINLPSFARGNATRATATEVLELQSYAASLIGLTAFQVNDLIRSSAQAFLDKVTDDLDEADAPIVILVDSQPSLLDAQATGASYRFTPVESIASPLGGAVERRNLLQVIPILTASPDVDGRALLEHVIRTFDLPMDLIAAPQADALSEGGGAPMPGQPGPGKVNVTEAVLESTLPANVLATGD